MYQTISQNQAQREEEQRERIEKQRKMDAIKALKKERVKYQNKYDEITKCNATLLSANGDLLIWREIERLNHEIEELQKGL